MTDPMTRPGDVEALPCGFRFSAGTFCEQFEDHKIHHGAWHPEPNHVYEPMDRRIEERRSAARAAHSPVQPVVGEELAEARATIEAMSGDAADLIDLMDEAAAMRTVLHHLLDDNRGRIHDSGCGICDAGRALLTADHELPSFAAATPEDQS